MASPSLDTPLPDRGDTPGDTITLDLSGYFSDADVVAEPLVYSVQSGLPEGTGLSVDPETGELSGTPTAADVADAPLSIVVRGADDLGNYVECTQLLTVASPGGGGSLRAEYSGLTAYYVDGDTGSDSNDGTTEGNAWATIQHAAANLPAGGNIVLIGGGDYVLNSTVTPANSGANAGAPNVFANRPGETVRAIAGSVTTLFDIDGVDDVWLDGLTLHGDSGNGRAVQIRGLANATRLRHLTFDDWSLQGGTFNYGTVYCPDGHSTGPVTGLIVEYCDWANMAWNGNANAAMILTYLVQGATIRYCQALDQAPPFWRQKDMSHGGPSVFTSVYRSHVRGSKFDIGGVNHAVDANTYYATWKFEELLLEQSPIGITNGDENAQGSNHYWQDLLVKNVTLIGSPLLWGVFGTRSNQAGTRAFNNIVDRSDGGDCWTNNKSSGSPVLDVEAVIDFVDYNGYVLPSSVGDWNFHYQYSPTGDEDYATWQAHTGTSGRGFDANSLRTLAPNFVNAASGDYRLDTGSPFLGAGKDDGTPSGAAVDLGCFAFDHWLPNVGAAPM